MPKSGATANGGFDFQKSPESCLELIDYLQRAFDEAWERVYSTTEAILKHVLASAANPRPEKLDQTTEILHQAIAHFAAPYTERYHFRYSQFVENYRQFCLPLNPLFRGLDLAVPEPGVFEGPIFDFDRSPPSVVVVNPALMRMLKDEDLLRRAVTNPEILQSPEWSVPLFQQDPSEKCTGSLGLSALHAFRTFWSNLTRQIHKTAVDRGELPEDWTPRHVTVRFSWNEAEVVERYPSFSLKSKEDLIRWLRCWDKRFMKPVRPAYVPPWERLAEEESYRPDVNDIARELLNCRRSLLTFGIPGCPNWDGTPSDVKAAEDRVLTVIEWLALGKPDADNPRGQTDTQEKSAKKTKRRQLDKHAKACIKAYNEYKKHGDPQSMKYVTEEYATENDGVSADGIYRRLTDNRDQWKK